MLIRPLTPDDVPAADATAWAALHEQIPDAFLHSDEERARRGRLRIAHLQRTDPGGAWVAGCSKQRSPTARAAAAGSSSPPPTRAPCAATPWPASSCGRP